MTISVVIPTYNATPFIREALESVLTQSKLPTEIIIVDDCSTDGTVAMIDSIARSSQVEIRVNCLSHNSGGPTKPMNVGIDSAQGEQIILLDQDDVMSPGRVKLHSEALAQPGISFSFGWTSRVDAYGECETGPFKSPVSRIEAMVSKRLTSDIWQIDPEKLYRDLLVNGSLIGASNIGFKKSCWQQVGRFREDLRVCWDYEFLCTLCTMGGIAFINQRVGYYRVHASNLHQRGDRGTREWLDLLSRHLAKPFLPIDTSKLRAKLAEIYSDQAYSYSSNNDLTNSLQCYFNACCFGANPGLCTWRSFKSIVRCVIQKISTKT